MTIEPIRKDGRISLRIVAETASDRVVLDSLLAELRPPGDKTGAWLHLTQEGVVHDTTSPMAREVTFKVATAPCRPSRPE